MPILDFLRRKDSGPWTEWLPCTHRKLTFDVSVASLDGTTVKSAFQDFERFGRPANKNPLDGGFEFPELGLEILVDREGRANSFTCVFSKEETDSDLSAYPTFEPCELELWHESRRLVLTGRSTRADIEAATGTLSEERAHGVTTHAVTLESTWLGFVFDEHDRLMLLDLEPPLGR